MDPVIVRSTLWGQSQDINLSSALSTLEGALEGVDVTLLYKFRPIPYLCRENVDAGLDSFVKSYGKELSRKAEWAIRLVKHTARLLELEDSYTDRAPWALPAEAYLESCKGTPLPNCLASELFGWWSDPRLHEYLNHVQDKKVQWCQRIGEKTSWQVSLVKFETGELDIWIRAKGQPVRIGALESQFGITYLNLCLEGMKGQYLSEKTLYADMLQLDLDRSSPRRQYNDEITQDSPYDLDCFRET